MAPTCVFVFDLLNYLSHSPLYTNLPLLMCCSKQNLMLSACAFLLLFCSSHVLELLEKGENAFVETAVGEIGLWPLSIAFIILMLISSFVEIKIAQFIKHTLFLDIIFKNKNWMKPFFQIKYFIILKSPSRPCNNVFFYNFCDESLLLFYCH